MNQFGKSNEFLLLYALSVHSMKVCDDPLLCLRGHETGKFITTGNKVGVTHLIEVSDNMSVSAKNDKPLLTAVSLLKLTQHFNINGYIVLRCLNEKISERKSWKPR